jgi:hypothetical protein
MLSLNLRFIFRSCFVSGPQRATARATSTKSVAKLGQFRDDWLAVIRCYWTNTVSAIGQSLLSESTLVSGSLSNLHLSLCFVAFSAIVFSGMALSLIRTVVQAPVDDGHLRITMFDPFINLFQHPSDARKSSRTSDFTRR